jgi:hypothetical protein
MTQRLPLIPKVPLTPRELGELAQLAFEWPIRQAPRLMLPLCILVAGILQAMMMVLFSISYRIPSEKTPDVPRFYFLPPESAAARQLAPWLEANDPAAFSPLRAARAASPALPPLKYRPSYEEPPPALRTLRSEQRSPVEPPLPPTSSPLQRVIRGVASPAVSLVDARASAVNSVVRWEDDLAERQLVEDAVPAPVPVVMTGTLRPAHYEVCVGTEGVPLHCVLMESSGDSVSDEAARVWIMARRFRPQSGESMSWGRVLVLWGVPAASALPNPSGHSLAKP